MALEPPHDQDGTCLSDLLIARFIVGGLTSQELARFEQHMDQCASCHSRVVACLVEKGGVQNGSAEQESSSAFRAGYPLRSGLFANRYQLQQKLGRGGMGEVYLAQDEILEQPVALKFLTPDLALQPEHLTLLKREVLLARRISHPNVCRVFDLGSHEQRADIQYFISMELLTGGSLRDRVKQGPLALPQVETIAGQLLEGLSEAHRMRIVHRDFKTDNVLFRWDADASARSAASAVITDFGLARPMTRQGTSSLSEPLIGSAAYMSPEQVEGTSLSPATDIYSFGVVLFELLTGSLPFVGPTPFITAMQRLQQPPPRPHSRRPQLPPQWDALVAACLAVEPERRPTAVEALARLRSAAVPSVVLSGAPLPDSTVEKTALAGAPVRGHDEQASFAQSQCVVAAPTFVRRKAWLLASLATVGFGLGTVGYTRYRALLDEPAQAEQRRVRAPSHVDEPHQQPLAAEPGGLPSMAAESAGLPLPLPGPAPPLPPSLPPPPQTKEVASSLRPVVTAQAQSTNAGSESKKRSVAGRGSHTTPTLGEGAVQRSASRTKPVSKQRLDAGVQEVSEGQLAPQQEAADSLGSQDPFDALMNPFQ